MKTTDTAGKTIETARAEALAIQVKHEAGGVNVHLRATLGRLYYSARRWGWAVRFHPVGAAPAVETFCDGGRFETVAQM